MWPNPHLPRFWSHLLKKFLMENFMFGAVDAAWFGTLTAKVNETFIFPVV